MTYDDGSQSTIERALELARNGRCSSIDDVRRQLRQERFPGVDEATSGMSIKAQLAAAIEKAKV